MGTLRSFIFLSPNTEKYITSMIDPENATFTSFNRNLQPAQFNQGDGSRIPDLQYVS